MLLVFNPKGAAMTAMFPIDPYPEEQEKTVHLLINELARSGNSKVHNFLTELSKNVPSAEIDDATYERMRKVLEPIMADIRYCHLPDTIALASVIAYINSSISLPATMKFP